MKRKSATIKLQGILFLALVGRFVKRLE